MLDRTVNYSYSLNDFEDDEKAAILEAKQEAVKNFSNQDTITELGTGSGGKTIVYKAGDNAVKLFCGITKKCGNENLDDEMTALHKMASTRFDIGMNFFRELGNIATLRSINTIQDTDSGSHPVNLIPFSGSDLLPWKCHSFNRVGVDYAFKMPLVRCLENELKTYKLQKQGIPKEQPENLATILAIGIDLCDALIVMHKNNIIHQDIKPQNIFLDHNNYCLGDLGIARKEDNRQYFREGTPAYWSPEQENGKKVDHRCDIYSLGLVLYELADTKPMSSHYEERIRTDKKLPTLKTAVPEGLKMILQNACEYEPSLRYQNAEAFKSDLCQLKKNTDYQPRSTRDTYKPRNPLPQSFRPDISRPPRSFHGGAGSFHNQQRTSRIFQPETVWYAGKLWYEESRKTGSRFAELKIDEKIMPLSSHSSHVTDFPIRISEGTDDASKPKRLSNVLKDTENLHNMYLIGEGGIGKTTALNSIMQDEYKNKGSYTVKNGKTVIPLFIELSKAPADYCNAYYASHSTFIHRYLYMLLASVQKQILLSENPEEMSQIMDKQDTSITDRIELLLNTDEDHTQYLLLLDGLNEVSKNQLFTKEKDFLGTPSELIVEEIKELLEKHKNVTAIITSRADETLSDLNDSFERLYLTGVSEEIIKEYLDSCEISSEQVSENSRLMETLKIPLFLKLYGELYNTADISTPGEILYAFFSERSTMYTARNRIAEIRQDHQKAGDAYGSNSVDEKMQWFILDFLLPELGWYMEKNDLYAVDLPTFRQVIDTVLKEENDTDICGTYGRKYFKEYLKGEDPIPNTQTYARQLLALDGPLDEDYASVIAKYCVYSLGILYVNNQNYRFIHQHIRDFFAAMKIITDISFASYIFKKQLDKNAAMERLHEINTYLLSDSIIHFMADLTNKLTPQKNSSFYINSLELYRNIYNTRAALGVKNITQIINMSKGSLSNIDFSELNLSMIQFNGRDISNSDFTNSLVNQKNFLPKLEFFLSIKDAAFSPDKNHVIILEGEQFKIYDIASLHEEFISKEDTSNQYNNCIVEYSISGKLFYILKEPIEEVLPYVVEIWDSQRLEIVARKRIFRLFHLGMNLEHRRFIKISPDDKYLIVSSNFDRFRLYPISHKERKKTIFSRKSTPLSLIARLTEDCSCIAVDPCEKYIVLDVPRREKFSLNILIYDAITLKSKINIHISTLEEYELIHYLLFDPNGQYLAVFSSDNIYILTVYNWSIYKTLSLNTSYGEIDSWEGGKFVGFESEPSLLLKLEFGTDYNMYHYILWMIEKDHLVDMSNSNDKIFDCKNRSILFGRNRELYFKKNFTTTSNSTAIYKEQNYNPFFIKEAFYTQDDRYLIIYSSKYIQMRNAYSTKVLYEQESLKTIASVCCFQSRLYIGYSEGEFEVRELETFKLMDHNYTLFSDIEKISLSSLCKYLVIQSDKGDKGNLFILYDAVSLKYICEFYGDTILFDDLNHEVFIGFDSNSSKMLERWSISTQSTDNSYCVKKLHTVCWDNFNKYIFKRIDKWIIMPDTSKFFLYIHESNKSTCKISHKLLIWDLKTWSTEKIIKSAEPLNYICLSGLPYFAEQKKSNVKLRNLRTLKYEFKIRAGNSSWIKVYKTKLLIRRRDEIKILDWNTREYKTILFIPGINFNNINFSQLHPTSDIDDVFLENLEMQNAIIKKI